MTRALQAVGLGALFAVGAVLGVVIGALVFVVSLVRGARAVHAEGVVCRAELVALAPAGEPLAGPALVRLSGAFARPGLPPARSEAEWPSGPIEGQATAERDVLGLAIRLQRAASTDARSGDQDLLLATFESFATARRDLARTDVTDYLGNGYSTVTPWWLPGRGAVTLRLVAPAPAAVDRATSRVARLDADLASGRARLNLTIDAGGAPTAIAELRLIERLTSDASELRASMFRHGRGLRPVGMRNGIRATVYPLSQAGRRLRGR